MQEEEGKDPSNGRKREPVPFAELREGEMINLIHVAGGGVGCKSPLV